MGERRDERQGGERAGKEQSDEVQVRGRRVAGEMTDQPDRTAQDVQMSDEGAIELPYDAVSINASAEEWQVPLWNAIHAWSVGDLTAKESAVVDAHAAVESAMRLTLRLERERVAAICDKLEALTRYEANVDWDGGIEPGPDGDWLERDDVLALVKEIRGA